MWGERVAQRRLVMPGNGAGPAAAADVPAAAVAPRRTRITSASAPPGIHADSTMRPPGVTMRAISARAHRASAAKITPNTETTASAVDSPSGSRRLLRAGTGRPPHAPPPPRGQHRAGAARGRSPLPAHLVRPRAAQRCRFHIQHRRRARLRTGPHGRSRLAPPEATLRLSARTRRRSNPQRRGVSQTLTNVLAAPPRQLSGEPLSLRESTTTSSRM